VGLRAAKAHRITQVARAMGQWAGAVRIVRSLARGRPCQQGSPITGAGLDPRVCDPSGTPAGIPSNGSDGEGCWGEKLPGRTPTLVLTLSGWLLFRKAARALCGLLIHEPPRSGWATRPQPQPMRIRGGWVERHQKSFEAPTAPSPKQPTASEPTARAKPTARGPRDQGLKNQEGSLGGRSCRDGRQRRR
jgi:hypothetical protein